MRVPALVLLKKELQRHADIDTSSTERLLYKIKAFCLALCNAVVNQGDDDKHTMQGTAAAL